MKQLHPLPIEKYVDLLASYKQQIESEFRHYLKWNTQYRYLLTSYSPYLDFSAQVQVHSFHWSLDEYLFEKETAVRNYVYQNAFTAECTIYFSDSQNKQSTSVKHTFNLECEYIFDTHPGSTATIEILDAQRKQLSNINESIFDFYRRSGIDGEDFTLGDDNLRDRFQRALYNCQSVAGVGVNPLDKWFELIYCLQRVRFTIANTALYKPYLDNPVWHGHFFIDRMVYPSHSTLYDERYFIYCEFTYQSFYHLWDRIGDILAEVVPTGLKEKAIDFSRVLDRIKLDQHLSQNLAFIWFDAFKTSEYNAMNKERRQMVHYETVTSKMKREHLNGFNDREEVEKRQRWIESRVDEFISGYKEAVEGIRQLTLFLETKDQTNGRAS